MQRSGGRELQEAGRCCGTKRKKQRHRGHRGLTAQLGFILKYHREPWKGLEQGRLKLRSGLKSSLWLLQERVGEQESMSVAAQAR